MAGTSTQSTVECTPSDDKKTIDIVAESLYPVEENLAFGDLECIGCYKNADACLKPEAYKDSRKIVIKNIKFKEITIATTKKSFEFEKCEFEKVHLPKDISRIHFKNCTFDLIEDNINLHGGTIKKLHLEKKSFKDKFYINREEKKDDKTTTTIENLYLHKVVFHENTKFNRCNIERIEKLSDVDFKKNADFNHCFFGERDNRDTEFYGVKFQRQAYFNETHFYQKVVFYKVTFLEYVSFLNAQFDRGIDLDSTTIKKEMNFFGAKGMESTKAKKETSQETYRIIKHNFKKLNNQIEANRFHALELEAKWRNMFCRTIKDCLTKWRYLLERPVYALHKATSMFGNSWFTAFRFIIYIGIFTTGLMYLDISAKENINAALSFLRSPLHYLSIFWDEGYFGKLLDKTLNYAYLLNRDRDAFKGHSAVMLFNKAALGYLYYQFVMAIRKDTKK